jgi:hypothetical protein
MNDVCQILAAAEERMILDGCGRGTAPRLSKKSTNKLTRDHLETSCGNSNKRMEAGRSKVKSALVG